METAALRKQTTPRAWLSQPVIANISVRLSLWLVVVALGGSLYEHLVVDTVWPDHPRVIAAGQGGIDRKLFWIPMHVALTLTLGTALISSWRSPEARRHLWIAVAWYAVMRVWSAVYFIPLALEFEQAPQLAPELLDQARTWVLLSLLRAPLLIGSLAALARASEALRDAASRA